ncbi:MAG: Phytoene synthase [Methanobacteriota archaeon]|nr:MAG: Phytoene synthase [Euryarchaeota archaeon]
MGRSAFLKSQRFRPSIKESYNYCEYVVKRSSTSFARSFKSLPNNKRNAVNALYAFCRRVDDIVDGDWLPSIESNRVFENKTKLKISELKDTYGHSKEYSDTELNERIRALLWYRERLDILESNPKSLKDPIFVALADTIGKFPIDVNNLRQLILGMEEDLFHTGCQTYDEMYSYCRKVASSVGLCLIEIYGYEGDDAPKFAEDMGIFLQMVNILRDIEEDYNRGRSYLPLDELNSFGIDFADLMEAPSINSKNWKKFISVFLKEIQKFRNSAMKLIPLLSKDSQYSPRLMCEVYDAILKEANRREGDIISNKLKLGFASKISFALASFGVRLNQSEWI